MSNYRVEKCCLHCIANENGLCDKYSEPCKYCEGYEKGRADAIDEVIRAIDEQNYCMQEECHFNACRSEGCPINRNAEVIFQTWLKKLKEQKNV